MRWTKPLVRYWCEHYYELRDYELNPFQEIRSSLRDIFVTGSKSNLSPYVETCDLNWEFDKALKKLVNRELEFRRDFLGGEGDNQSALFEEFCRILEGNNEDNA